MPVTSKTARIARSASGAPNGISFEEAHEYVHPAFPGHGFAVSKSTNRYKLTELVTGCLVKALVVESLSEASDLFDAHLLNNVTQQQLLDSITILINSKSTIPTPFIVRWNSLPDTPVCDICREEVDLDDTVIREDDNARICEACKDDSYVCGGCGSIYADSDSLTSIGDELYCDTCRDDQFTQCERCESYVDPDNVSRVRTRQSSHTEEWCEDCHDNHVYGTCDDCGTPFSDDGGLVDNNHSSYCHYCGHSYCSECDSFVDETCPECGRCSDCCSCSRGLHNYGHKPTPRFTSITGEFDAKKFRFLGGEIEMDDGDLSDIDFDEWQDHPYFYFKKDGSLSADNGMEMVTHPATLAGHETTRLEAYTKFLAHARSAGYKSHNASTSCGLHVHMDRRWLTPRGWARFEYFTLRHNTAMKNLARRDNPSYASFLVKKLVVKDCSVIDTEYGRRQSRRNAAVNFLNDKTVECRMFKGTLNLETIFATFELCHALATYVENRSFLDIHTRPFDDFRQFVSSNPLYAKLSTYITRRFADKEI